MKRAISRRRLLSGTASAAGVAWAVGGVARARATAEDGAFDPVEHGFGFRNWTLRDQYFEAPPSPSRRSIRETVTSDWRDLALGTLGLDTAQLPDRVVDAIAAQLRTALVQRAGTNGHCYGMVLTAQQYFEQPSTIPVDRRVASEIEDPTVPIEEPTAPVYEEIVQRQADQFLKFRSWLGRRAMVHPEWIDTSGVLGDVRSVVETFGTATLSLFDGNLLGHQVLAYGFEADRSGLTISIYDPNRTAVSYRGELPALRFDHGDGGLSMQPYGRYTGILFNRYDQIERATDRGTASPLDHLSVDRSTVRASLFPLALVSVDAAATKLAVVAPDGEELDRIRGTYMDRSRGENAHVRSRYGAEPGTYRIAVFGREATDYELTTVVAGPGRTIVEATHANSIGAGALHEYELAIPDSGEGTVERTRRGGLHPALLGGAVGGVAAGAIGHRTLQRRRNLDDGV